MSNYEPAQLSLASSQPLEIRLYDSDFRVVGRGFGSYENRNIEAGIYQVELRAGVSCQQFLLRLAPGQRYERWDLRLAISSAAPLPSTDNYHEAHFYAAQKLSAEAIIRRGSSESGILLFARNVSKTEINPRALESFEWTLFDSNYVEVLGIREQTLWSAAGFAGVSSRVDPGGYLLRVKNKVDRYAVDLPIWASPGWQTMVFLPISIQPGSDDRQQQGPTVRMNAASVHLAPLGGWNPGYDEASVSLALAVETCLPALAAGRVLVPRRQISRMLNEKFQDPMFGIVGAYCMCLGWLRNTSFSSRKSLVDEMGGGDPELLMTVLNNLTAMLGKEHPDLAGLRAAAPPDLRRGPLPTQIAWPPMIGLGYQELVRSESEASIVPESLAEQAAGWVELSGPWTVWADWHTNSWSEQWHRVSDAPALQFEGENSQPNKLDWTGRINREQITGPEGSGGSSAAEEVLPSEDGRYSIFERYLPKSRRPPKSQPVDIAVGNQLRQYLRELAEQDEESDPRKLMENISELSSAMGLPMNSVRRALMRLIEKTDDSDRNQTRSI